MLLSGQIFNPLFWLFNDTSFYFFNFLTRGMAKKNFETGLVEHETFLKPTLKLVGKLLFKRVS